MDGQDDPRFDEKGDIAMKARRIALLVVAASTMMAGTTFASTVTLVTPPLAPDGSNVFKCRIANVTDHDIECSIIINAKDGIALVNTPVTLARHASDLVEIEATGQQYYCEFRCAARSRDVRGSATVYQPGTGTISALAATDGRGNP
jgi:hypothetical protein